MYYILPLSPTARCVLYYNTILARGPLRAPVASPSRWLFQGIEPVPEPADRIAGQPLAGLGDVPLHLHRTMDLRAYRRPLKPTRKGAFGAPLHPIDLAGVPAPRTPDHFMETTSSRPWKGAFTLPLPWTHPIEQGHVTPLATPIRRTTDLSALALASRLRQPFEALQRYVCGQHPVSRFFCVMSACCPARLEKTKGKPSIEQRDSEPRQPIHFGLFD